MTPDEVKDSEDFVRFVRWLQRDLRQNEDQWENTTLELFLGGLAAWTTSMDGYYAN